jgi:hypothetical protein
MIPNIPVESVALLLCIQEVPGSNIIPETGFYDLVFVWFYSVPPGEY